MNVLRCQVRLSKVVQIDIPEEKLGDQLPDVLAKLTARSLYGYDYQAEVLEISRSHVEDTPLKRVICMDCGCVDFIKRNGDDSGWEFIGYDDDAELHKCPSCTTI